MIQWWYSNIAIDNNRYRKTRQNWKIPIRNKLWCLFRTNILICTTKTPQLCYKLESSSLRSIRFLLGLWYLSWRPWWWESTVNRLSFYPELLLYKIIIDSEKKNPCWGSFVLGVYRKNSTTAASSENMAFILKCNFTSSSTDNNRLFCSNNGWPLLYPFGWPVWNNWVAGKVTGNLKRQRE